MKITAFNSSPRVKNSVTHRMVEEFFAGAEAAGAETENVFLATKKIRNCMGCFRCWTKTPGKCFIKDDMEELRGKFMTSDVVVFATPLYADNVSGIMKNFMDRLIPILHPYLIVDRKFETVHRKRFKKYPRIVAISNCGFPEFSQFQVLKLLFRRLARNMHTKVIAEIYRPQGPLLASAGDPRLKFILDGYLNALRQAGRDVARYRRIMPLTDVALGLPLLPYSVYRFFANRHWDREMAEKDSPKDWVRGSDFGVREKQFGTVHGDNSEPRA